MLAADPQSNDRIDQAYDHGISVWTAFIVGFYIVFGRLTWRTLKGKENASSTTLPGV